jgi:hypothetical protein
MLHLCYYTALPLLLGCARSAERTPEQRALQPSVAMVAPEHAPPQPAAASPFADPRQQPSATATARPQSITAGATLPALQLARLDYTFQAAELVQRAWPAMRPAQTCVMLVEPTSQWVLNCNMAPRGFARNAQRFRDHPVYHHEGGTFDAGGQARSTAQLLAATPAAAQVPSGVANKSLPGPDPWLVVGSLEALTAFHPSFTHATTEAWVSVLMHELVHTHQLRAPGSERFVAAIVRLERTPAALTAFYQRDARYRALVEQEYALLTRAARAKPKASDARRALARWLTLYRRRSDALRDRPQLLADDALFTYLEGVARFVESQFLEDPGLHPAQPLAGDPRYHNYEMFVGHGYAGSPNRQLDEHYFYAIGYHVCVLLERVDPSWRSRVHGHENFLIDLVREVAEPAK